MLSLTVIGNPARVDRDGRCLLDCHFGAMASPRGCEVLPDPANTRAYDKEEGGVVPAGGVVEFGGGPRPPRWMSAVTGVVGHGGAASVGNGHPMAAR